jgi:hypothetical protein
MARHLAPANGHEGLVHSHEEEAAENCNRRRLARSRPGHADAKVQPAQATDKGQNQKDATGPAMKLKVTASNASRKLERREQQDEAARNDVQQRQETVVGISTVDLSDYFRPFKHKRVV